MRRRLPRILDHLPLISLLAVLWLSCFSGLSSFVLVDLVDEGFYSSISRHMAQSGDWVTPSVGGQAYLGKPPLLFWAQALSIRLLGPTILAVRLPSALAVAATSLVLWVWMKQRRQERIGWLAAILYTMFPLTMGMARIAMTDALLTLWLTLAIIGFVHGDEGKPRGYLLAVIGVALATLTKGPIGFLLPGATFLLWLMWKRELRELRRSIWILGLAIFAALVLPWYIAVWKANGNYFLRDYFLANNLQIYFGRAFGNEHERPFWFYFPVLICSCFPFIAFVPRAWWSAVRKATSRRREQSDDAGIWALWAALFFVFFSLSQSKLSSYMLPVLPSLALLVASRLSGLLKNDQAMARGEAFVVGFFGFLIGLILLTCGVLGLQWRGQPSPVPYAAKLLSGTIGWQTVSLNEAGVWYRLSPFLVLAPYTLIFALLLLAATALILLWRRNLVRVLVTGAALCLSLTILFAHFAMPAWSRFDIEPMWQLAESTRPSLQKGEPLVLYGIHPPRTSVRFLLDNSDLITETTDATVLDQVVTQYPRGHILTIEGIPLPTVNASTQVERKAGHWALCRFEH